MPALPPQSPARVGDEPAAVPAIVMSRKSQSVADRLLTVSVRGVPSVSERKKMRRTAVAPAQVRVPLIVQFPPKAKKEIPAEAGAVNVRLLKVFAPETVHPTAEVDVKDTLYQVSPVLLKLCEDGDPV